MRPALESFAADAVYGTAARNYPATDSPEPRRHTVAIVADATPTALARVFGQLSTFTLVPSSASIALCGDETISIVIDIDKIPAGRIDLLCRKVSQLTETISVSAI